MDASPFSVILTELIRRIDGAFACALVDREGETVDYAGTGDPFDVKVAAAHFRILLQQVEEYGVLGVPRSLLVRGRKRSILVRGLPDGYAVVLLLRKRAGFAASERAFLVCERALAAEAGWMRVEPQAAWYPVVVEVDLRGRPKTVGDPGVAVEVLGSVMGLPRRERGFRVRLASGSELTLVREPGDRWYGDEHSGAPKNQGENQAEKA